MLPALGVTHYAEATNGITITAAITNMEMIFAVLTRFIFLIISYELLIFTCPPHQALIYAFILSNHLFYFQRYYRQAGEYTNSYIRTDSYSVKLITFDQSYCLIFDYNSLIIAQNLLTLQIKKKCCWAECRLALPDFLSEEY